MPSGAQCTRVPVYPCTRLSVYPCVSMSSQVSQFCCAPETFKFSEPSHVTPTDRADSGTERERVRDCETAIRAQGTTVGDQRRDRGRGANCDSNYQLNSQCVPLSLSLSGCAQCNLPCSHNLVALSPLTLLCSAHYQAALCCPITSQRQAQRQGQGQRQRTDLYLVHNLAKQLTLSFRRGSFVPALK